MTLILASCIILPFIIRRILMLSSMTAFANGDTQTKDGRFTCEIRSVNHRFLDLSIKQPDFLRKTEATIRKNITGKLARGKVDVFIKYYPNPDADINELSVNKPLLEQLIKCERETVNLLNNSSDCSKPFDYLTWPQVVIQSPKDTSELEQTAIELVQSVSTGLQNSRQREGESLKITLLEKVSIIENIIIEVESHIPQIQLELKNRIQNKLDEMNLEVDSERFEQELAFLLQKADIIEETDRFRTHIKEVRRVLDLSEPVGRRLDFLIQELHREANTIGSKSNTVLTSQKSIDLKVAIEQMREQIQNIE